MIYEFGVFKLDTDRLELRGPSGPVPLEPKNFALLTLLVEERGRAVSKAEIFDKIWPDVIVTDASLSTAIRQVRRALEDDGDQQSLIKTVRGHGFRFVAEARVSVAAMPQKQTSNMVERPISSNRPTIAIRPFQLIGGGTEYQAIADAIPAELIVTLSKLRWIKVIARASSFQFARSEADLSNMAVTLGAQFVVSGLVEHIGSRLAIVVELSDTVTGEVIWTDRATGGVETVFEMREKIARDLANALELRLPLHEVAKLAHAPSENLDAWDHYHLAVRHMYRYNRHDNAIAAGHFSKAQALDPNFARAAGGLSYTEFQNAFQHFGSDAAHHRRLALEQAEHALDLDPHDPFCNLMYGRVKWLMEEPEDALIWVDKAIAANPNYAFGYFNRATLFNALCNGQNAEENAAIAVRLSPIDPHLQSMFGTRAFAALLSGDIPAAVSFSERALNAPNPHLYVYTIAALIHDKSGAEDKARHFVETIKAKNVSFGRADFLRHYAMRGDPDRRAEIDATLDRLGL